MHELSFKIESKIVVQLFVFTYYFDIIKIEIYNLLDTYHPWGINFKFNVTKVIFNNRLKSISRSIEAQLLKHK